MGRKGKGGKSGVSAGRGGKSRLRKLLRRIFAALILLLLSPIAAIVVFRWLPVPASSFMIEQSLFGLGTQESCNAVQYRWVPRSRISPHAAIAVLASEDQNFPNHHGFDLKAIADALETRIEGGRTRGASTISQQVAKNLFLWPGRNWIRKGLEAYLTAAIELLWPKWRILEVYLNIAQFGPCTFGVEAAADAYFSTTSAGLSAEQGALLASVLPNPVRLHADRPSEYLRERTSWILNQVRLLGGTEYLKKLDGLSPASDRQSKARTAGKNEKGQ